MNIPYIPTSGKWLHRLCQPEALLADAMAVFILNNPIAIRIVHRHTGGPPLLAYCVSADDTAICAVTNSPYPELPVRFEKTIDLVTRKEKVPTRLTEIAGYCCRCSGFLEGANKREGGCIMMDSPLTELSLRAQASWL